MTGNLRAKKGRYYIAVSYKDEAGSYRQKSIPTGLTEKGNKRKAEQMLRDVLKEYEDKNVMPTREVLFSDFISEWLGFLKPTIRPNTYIAYRNNVNKHIVPYFKRLGVTLQKLQPLLLQRFYTEKMDEGLAGVTVLKIHTNIHKCLDYAMMTLNLIPYNPADRVTLPKKKKFVGKYYDTEQLQELFRVIKGEPIEPAVLLAANYGLRRSEVLGLRWQDINFAKNTVSICHTAVEVNNHVTYSDQVKTKSSFRTLPLMKHIKAYLLELRLHQNEMRVMCQADYDGNDYICKWDDGKTLKPNYVTEKFHKLLLENELPVIRFHDGSGKIGLNQKSPLQQRGRRFSPVLFFTKKERVIYGKFRRSAIQNYGTELEHQKPAAAFYPQQLRRFKRLRHQLRGQRTAFHFE